MSEEISTTEADIGVKTRYDVDIQQLRDDLESMKTELLKTIGEYRQANADLWARLQAKMPESEPTPDVPEVTSEDVFNSIMRRT